MAKIIWAVDIAETQAAENRRALATIRQIILRRPDYEVEPVYVLRPIQLDFSADMARPIAPPYKGGAEQRLDRLCRELPVPNLIQPTVIEQSLISAVDAAKMLTTYAQQTKAEAIVIGSHGRKGLKRALMGSFAETLLLEAAVPVIVSGPEVSTPRVLDHILFATDLFGNSELLFRRVVDLAVEYKARITLFHSVPNPVEPVFQSGVYLLGGAWVPIHAYFSKEVLRHQERAMKWGRWARRQGVPIEVVVDTKTVHIADAILGLAEQQKIGLIAMDSQSGAVAATLLGSIARNVVREANCPVWILRADTLDRRSFRAKGSQAAKAA